MVHKYTGQAVVIDTWARRRGRMITKVRSWAAVVQDAYPNSEMLMVTLTYDTQGTMDQATSYNPRDITDFIRRLRRKLRGGLLAYAWVSEVQGNGNLHYHVMVVRQLGGPKVGAVDDLGIWPCGMSNIVKAKSPWYMVSYTGKSKQKNFGKYPKGARLFSVWLSSACLLKPGPSTDRKEGWSSSWEYSGAGETREYVEGVLVPTAVARLPLDNP